MMDQSLRIAVAMDDPRMCQFYQEVLPELGHQVCAARTCAQLLEQCRILRPDLVITEVRLPDIGGLLAIQELSRDQAIPVLLVTDGRDAELGRRIATLPHIMGCLTEPVEKADLAIAIPVALSRFEHMQSLRQEAAELRQALEDRKLIERAKGAAMRYTGWDEEEAFRRLRKLASDQNRKLVEVAQAVINAAEVFHQLERGQPSDGRARHDGHSRHGNGKQAHPPAAALNGELLRTRTAGGFDGKAAE
jgi:two-component system, response regulator PdtaR